MQISFFDWEKIRSASNKDANKFFYWKKDMITSRFLKPKKKKKILTKKKSKTYSNRENIYNTWYKHLKKIKTKQTFIHASPN